MAILWVRKGGKCGAGPLHLLWVWKMRNRIAFEDDVLSIQKLKLFCLFSVVGNQAVHRGCSFNSIQLH